MSSNRTRQAMPLETVPTKGMEFAPNMNIPQSGHHRSNSGNVRNSANPFSNPIQMKPINSMQHRQQQQQQQKQQQKLKSHSWTVDHDPDQTRNDPYNRNNNKNTNNTNNNNDQLLLDESTEAIIHNLHQKVRQLTNELTTTQKSHQLSSDQYRAEITMLHSTIEHQAQRHEQIISSLRTRLVESEVARNKMQDALSQKMEQELNQQEEMKKRWKEMIVKVGEDKVWVDEQMSYWKESMEEYKRKNLGSAKMRGGLDAGLSYCGVDVGVGGEKGELTGGGGGGGGESGSNKDERQGGGTSASHRPRWGEEDSQNDDNDDGDDDSEDTDDTEARRLFSLPSSRHL